MKSPLRDGQLIEDWIVDDSEYAPLDPVPAPRIQPNLSWVWRIGATIFLLLLLLEVFDAR